MGVERTDLPKDECAFPTVPFHLQGCNIHSALNAVGSLMSGSSWTAANSCTRGPLNGRVGNQEHAFDKKVVSFERCCLTTKLNQQQDSMVFKKAKADGSIDGCTINRYAGSA